MSQKQIKEDISKHQRKACSTALESFRGNNPERVTGKSLLCFPSVFRETGFTMHPQFCQGERSALVQDRQAVRTQLQAWGLLRGSQGTRFLSDPLFPSCSKRLSLKQWSLFQPGRVQEGGFLWKRNVVSPIRKKVVMFLAGFWLKPRRMKG